MLAYGYLSVNSSRVIVVGYKEHGTSIRALDLGYLQLQLGIWKKVLVAELVVGYN